MLQPRGLNPAAGDPIGTAAPAGADAVETDLDEAGMIALLGAAAA